MNKQEVCEQIVRDIGNYHGAYPPSEWRERLIRAEYNDSRLLYFVEKEDIR